MPDVTERNTKTSQTTKEITPTDIKEIRVAESDLFLGSKYLRAIFSSNTNATSLLYTSHGDEELDHIS